MKTTEKYIQEIRTVHGDKYDYSKVTYRGCREKICIICPEHGEFLLRADLHLAGKGCPKCGHLSTGLKCRKHSTTKHVLSYPEFDKIENPKLSDKYTLFGSIYIFINKVNNKVYIGQTYAKYTDRWAKHNLDSKTKLYKFYFAIRKYGWDNFDKFVIWQSEALDNTFENKLKLKQILNEKEKFYIVKYDSIKNGYNTTEGGEGHSSQMSNETKSKLKYRTGAKPVYQYDLEHNLIKTWLSMNDIKLELGFCKDGVRECCNKQRSSYKNFIWEFAPLSELPSFEKKVHNPIINKIVLQYDIQGKFIKEWASATLIEQELHFDSHCIRGCCRGVYKTSNGYIWKYKTNNNYDLLLSMQELESKNLLKKPILQFSLDNILIKKWDSIESILLENLNFKRASIRNCLNGKSKTSYKYIWKYEDYKIN